MTTLADRLAVTRNHPTGFDWMRLLLSTSIIGWHTIALSYGLHVERFYLISPFWRPPVVAILGLFFCLSGFGRGKPREVQNTDLIRRPAHHPHLSGTGCRGAIIGADPGPAFDAL